MGPKRPARTHKAFSGQGSVPQGEQRTAERGSVEKSTDRPPIPDTTAASSSDVQRAGDQPDREMIHSTRVPPTTIPRRRHVFNRANRPPSPDTTVASSNDAENPEMQRTAPPFKSLQLSATKPTTPRSYTRLSRDYGHNPINRPPHLAGRPGRYPGVGVRGEPDDYDDSDFIPGVYQPSHSGEPDECGAQFVAIDQDGDGRVSYEELHRALLNNNGGTFFLSNTVKYLVSIFEKNGDGVIRLDEFRPLWEYLSDLRRMFDSFDTDHDGRVGSTELGRALDHYSTRVTPRILDMTMEKYCGPPRDGRRPGLGLDQFVCACMVIRQMCQLYERRSNVSRDEFLLAILALP